MAIDEAEVRRIAGLCKLELCDTDVERLRRQLGAVLDYVARLDELDVGDVPPAGSPLHEPPPPRTDEPSPSLATGEALANAPDAAAGHFRVPRVLRE